MTSKQISIDEAKLSQITCGPLPASRKVYASGKIHPSLRVPMRQILQGPTHQTGRERNQPNQE